MPAKTLFQKTRSDASKLQKTIYNARVLPPIPTAKGYGVVPQMAIASPSSSSSRVTVNTVIKKRPTSAPLTLKHVTSETTLSAKSGGSAILPTPQPLTTTSSPADTPQASEGPPRTAKSPSTNTTIKKDPMASLFVPKRKAYSQRPL